MQKRQTLNQLIEPLLLDYPDLTAKQILTIIIENRHLIDREFRNTQMRIMYGKARGAGMRKDEAIRMIKRHFEHARLLSDGYIANVVQGAI